MDSEEERAWAGEDYDREVAALLERHRDDPERLVSVARATLARDVPRATESRAACVALLLPLGPPARPLVLDAWFHLAATAASGPDQVPASPDLPPGVLLPTGADPELITDPGLREKALALATEHAAKVTAWTAKQAALRHLRALATTVTEPELARALSLAEGVPEDVRERLAAVH